MLFIQILQIETAKIYRMRSIRPETWIREFSSQLSEKWKVLPLESLAAIAILLIEEDVWKELSPKLAAHLFSAWTEEYCWVDGVNVDFKTFPDENGKNNSSIYHSNEVSPEMCMKAKELQAFWEAAGYPDSVRPTAHTLKAIRAYEMSQQ